MIATNPYYITSFSTCHCIWTNCRCWTQNGAWQMQGIPLWDWKATDPLPKSLANKRRMEALPRHEPVAQRARLKTPSVRPSIQALSMRIR